MNRCTVEVGEDLVGRLSCLVQRRLWRRACVLGGCVGRGSPGVRFFTGLGLHKAWQCLFSLPSGPREMPAGRHCRRTGCPAGSTLLLCVPAPLLSCHLSRGSKQAAPLAPTGTFLLPGQSVLWCYPCSLELRYLWLYTEHCCTLVRFCSRLCMTNFPSGHAGKVKKQNFHSYLILQV